MTNPNNAVGTNAAYSGRTSPNALNDVIGGFTKGVLSGWACSPKSGMTVQLGGVTGTRDVALAEDNNGNKLTINNRSGAPVEVTLTGAPVANNRIDCIVAYVDNPATGDGSTTDNPNTCGIIAVSGTVAANPTAPSDATIRSAITTDGATGGTAYYVILASITVGTGVTTIGSGVIAQGDACQSLAAIADGSVTTAKLADSSVTSQKVDWTTIGSAQVMEQIYSGTPTKGTVNLTKPIADFKWLLIVFRREDVETTRNSAIVSTSKTKAALMTSAPDGSTFSFYSNRIELSTSSITRSSGCAVAFTSNGQAGYGSSNEIKIEEVWGIR